MTTENSFYRMVNSSREDAHRLIDKLFDEMLQKNELATESSSGTIVYNQPSEQDCLHPRNKTGVNLTEDGVETLFRLLDDGAGYNSAGRRMAITQTAVKNRKKDWIVAGGENRVKRFLPHLDTVT